MADVQSKGRQSRRWLLAIVAAFTVLAIFEALTTVFDVPGARGHVGWYLDNPDDPVLITYVQPGQPAFGVIQVGDRIDLDRLYPVRARNFDPIVSWRPMPGTRIAVPLIRHGKRIVVPLTLGSANAEPLYQDISIDFTTFVTICALLIGAWLLIRRPTIMTLSFFAFLIGVCSFEDNQVLSRFGYWPSLTNYLISQVLQALSAFIIVFAARAPNDSTSRWRSWFERLAMVLFIFYALSSLYSVIAWSVLGIPERYVYPPAWIGYVQTWGIIVVALAAVARSYIESSGRDRERMKWIALGFIFWVVSATGSQIGQFTSYHFWLNSINIVLFGTAIGSMAYGVIKARIVDVAFVISRALVATILAGVIIVAFALIDWLVSKKLETTRIGTIAEIGFAIALGFWFNRLHSNVDKMVDRVFFRSRHLAEERLGRAAHAVLHSTTRNAIGEFLVEEPCGALDLASAALFEPGSDSTWFRTRSIGWDDSTLTQLAANDALLLHIQAEQIALRTTNLRWPVSSLPSGNAHPAIAIPILARRHVVAIALYGEHCTGADLDTDEVRAIEKVADAAGAAFDHVEAETLRIRCEALERRLHKAKREKVNPA